MNHKLVWLILLLIFVQSMASSSVGRSLSYEECRLAQSNCTEMVYPYLQNSQYMFPTNLEHVHEMCKMWSKFVDCIRRYISNCFEESRRALFHKSVENSIDTVHAICSSKVYQNEYLDKATCFKKVAMDHCGYYYGNYKSQRECPSAPPTTTSPPPTSTFVSRDTINSDVTNESPNESSIQDDKKITSRENVEKFDEAGFDTGSVSEEFDPTQARTNDRSAVSVEQQGTFATTTTIPTIITSTEMLNTEKVDDGLDNFKTNQIDSIEAMESKLPEEDMIVYTMKPESRVGELSYVADSSAFQFDRSLTYIGHIIIVLTLTRWFLVVYISIEIKQKIKHKIIGDIGNASAKENRLASSQEWFGFDCYSGHNTNWYN
ncbi:hypothetical protein BLOT_009480 [Blomia tropicalis]|nr:hypothetical protein BLOT_009480 [Blomia tropicalis]